MVRGFVVCCANEKTKVIEKFDWGNALIEVVITSAIAFFSALAAGEAAAGINTINMIEPIADPQL
ncbi:MAG: hypothetical protein WC046_10160 [Candidatus Bathyarchaeia archaeon]